MTESQGPLRIGVVAVPTKGLNEEALRFFILAMNKEQDLIEFEFYNLENDPLCDALQDGQTVARRSIRDQLPVFAARAKAGIASRSDTMGLLRTSPDRLVVVSQSRFEDNFYSTRLGAAAVLALGSWQRYMAPPSFVEFVQALLLREAVAHLCPKLSGSVHLGNKGCLLDFTEILSEARYKVLRGFVCNDCRVVMRESGQPELPEVLVRLLDRTWLGDPSDARSPAGIMVSLRYDLFTVKGRKESPMEAMVAILRTEGVRQILSILGAIVLAVSLILLGVNTG